MADDSDDQSSVQDAEGSGRETSDQGMFSFFDVEGDVPAIAHRPMMNAYRKPPHPSQF